MSAELRAMHRRVYHRALTAASEAEDLATDLRELAAEHGDDGCFEDEAIDAMEASQSLMKISATVWRTIPPVNEE